MDVTKNITEITANIEKPLLLETFLKRNCGISARLLRKLKRPPCSITRNGNIIRTIDTVFPGDVILLETADKTEITPNGNLENINLLYEDENAAVFNKPPYMPVHPSHKHTDDTLGNYFTYLYPDKTFRPINRLDRDTSGTCVIAKGQHSAFFLQKSIKKIYYAIVEGETPPSGTINLPIKRAEDSTMKRIVSPDGMNAVTNFETLASKNGISFLKIILETGRTHQIRVHFSATGHALLGDDLYGGNISDIKRQALHCGTVSFPDEKTGKIITVNAPLPKDFADILAKFGIDYKL